MLARICMNQLKVWSVATKLEVNGETMSHTELEANISLT